jgi:DNA-binding transcriptional MerR regulator
MRGRTALYQRRHVLQLVAIKHLQAKGLSLVDIQARLLGASDAELARLARLPSGFTCQPTTSTSGSNAQKPSPSPDQPSPTFWKARPAPPAAAEGAGAMLAMPAVDRPPTGDQSPPVVPDSAAPVPLLVGVPLSPEVSLLLPAHRDLDEVDRDALRAAAQPLLELLLQRRILPRKD